MVATNQDLLIEQGASLALSVAVGVSYAGLQPRAMVKERFPSSGLALPQLATARKWVDLTCSVVDGQGNTVISLTAAQTAAIPAPPNARNDERQVFIGFWDLEIPLVSGSVDRVRQGRVNLSREMTF